jgi:hypothetical protein
MNLSVFQRLGRNAFHASSLLFGMDSGPATEPPVDVRSLEQRLREVQGQVAPGFMALHAVRHGPDIVDFEWEFADPAASRLMNGGTNGLVGKRLVEVLANRPGRVEVFNQYRRVVEFGASKAVRHWIDLNASPAILRHAAVHLHDGVAVILTNLSAVRRELALRREIETRAAMAPVRSGLFRA